MHEKVLQRQTGVSPLVRVERRCRHSDRYLSWKIGPRINPQKPRRSGQVGRRWGRKKKTNKNGGFFVLPTEKMLSIPTRKGRRWRYLCSSGSEDRRWGKDFSLFVIATPKNLHLREDSLPSSTDFPCPSSSADLRKYLWI